MLYYVTQVYNAASIVLFCCVVYWIAQLMFKISFTCDVLLQYMQMKTDFMKNVQVFRMEPPVVPGDEWKEGGIDGLEEYREDYEDDPS